MVQLTKSFKEELKCAQYDRSSENYCPVISVGGSHPGFLSAMFRLAYSNSVDISYASSAPLKLYAQTADQDVYYDTRCANAVRVALREAKKLIEKAPSVDEAVKSMNMCVDSVPDYITKLKTLSDDVIMAVGFSFADFDMNAYPPGPDLGLYKACQVFQDEGSTMEKMANFFQLLKDGTEEEEEESPGLLGEESNDCFDLSVFLPDGENSRIATSDWSGSGSGNDGMMWDFQLCTTLIDPIGFSAKSMFPPREWTYEDLTKTATTFTRY